MNLRNYKSVKERRTALAKETSVSFLHIGSFTLNEATASSRNCENMIGVTQVPLGIAGPLKAQSSELRIQSYYIPLATTEGALVASVNRGCKAINESGGAFVKSQRIGATRGPVFRVDNLSENQKLYEFLKSHFEELQKVASSTSHHLTLKKLSSKGVGKYHYVRFVFDTQDAMGMNMVTIATERIASYIEKKTNAKFVSVSGNFCVDKKPSWQNFVNNRGIKAWAEATISRQVLKSVLKTSAKKIYDVWLAKCLIGSAMSGSLGFNAQYANVIAALFLATGQDVAHVVEGSLGITTTEIIPKKNSQLEEDLYVSVYLPDLMVGTVGGGTGLATQQEALKLLGVAGGNEGRNALKLAEITAGAVLAGELSLLASLAEGSLAKVHKRLGRGER